MTIFDTLLFGILASMITLKVALLVAAAVLSHTDWETKFDSVRPLSLSNMMH